MSIRAEVNRLLAQGIAAAQAGQQRQAYHLLLDVIELDQHNELAWLWLSTVTRDLNDQRICLENVLTLNPNNTLARERLAALPSGGARADATANHADRSARQPSSAATSTSAAVTLWPVVAFWSSTSLFFVGGGVASLFRFAEILMRARGVMQNLSLTQIAWLPMAFFFITFGFTGFRLAWQLAHHQIGGYYGSLIFGLLLTLLGPVAGLILDPPNYLGAVCTGLTPATAVLLTLASMANFESGTGYA